MRKPIVNQAADRIVEYINLNRLPADSKMPTEQALCKELNVARSSLREAYRLLHAQGYITLKPGKGAFVAPPVDQADTGARVRWLSQHKLRYMDLLEVRANLETFAARLSAQRITDEQIAQLKQNLDMFQEHMFKSDSSRLLANLDAQFHEIIFRSTGNIFLGDINDLITKEIMEYRYAMMKIESQRENTYLPHIKVYLALKEHDPEGSAQAMQEHLVIAEKDMVELVKEQEGAQNKAQNEEPQ